MSIVDRVTTAIDFLRMRGRKVDTFSLSAKHWAEWCREIGPWAKFSGGAAGDWFGIVKLVHRED